jgi:hypothetical protein
MKNWVKAVTEIGLFVAMAEEGIESTTVILSA